MIEPPKRVTPAQIPARDYVFIVDVSGSMHGFPLETAKALMRDLLGGPAAHATPSTCCCSPATRPCFAQTPLPATPDNIDRGIELIDQQQGGGGTELLPALKRALALPGGEDRVAHHRGRHRRIRDRRNAKRSS